MSLFRRSSETPRQRRWRRRLLSSLLLLSLLLGLAPTLVAHTPLLQWIATRALVPLHGQVRVGGASLSWFSAPVLTDIEVHDTQGQMLARIPRIESSKSLFGLVCHPFAPGTFRIVQPSLRVVCAGGRTNLEDVLASWLEGSAEETTGPNLALRAEVVQAHFLFRDEDTGKETTLDPLDLTLELSPDQATSIHLQLHVRSGDAKSTGHLDTDLRFRANEPGLHAEGKLNAEGLPLALAEPFLRRIVPGLHLAGALGANLVLSRERDGAEPAGIRLKGSLSVRGFSLSAPAWLGADQLVLDRIELPCRLTLDGSRLRVERAVVKCDVGTLRLAGMVDLSKGLGGLLRQPGCEAGLEVDLVRLTDLFPNTLGLSKITRLTQGRMDAHLRSVADAAGTHWQGDLNTSALRALFEGQPIAWKAPLQLKFRTNPATDALPLPSWLRCDSDFLQVVATGTPEKMEADIGYNLDRLSSHMRGLIDLGGFRLGGKGAGHVTLVQTAPGHYQVKADVNTSSPQLVLPGGRVWRDGNARCRLEASAEETPAGSVRVSSGTVHMELTEDTVDVCLVRPIADLFSAEAIAARIHINGDLARWQNRLGLAATAANRLQLNGQADLRADLCWETEAVLLQDVKLHCQAFRCADRGLSLQEPTLALTTSGRWALDSGALTLKATQLAAPGLSAVAPGLTITDQVAGSIAVRGDLNHLQAACGGSLACALPVLAGAAQVEGEVSLNLNDVRLPLNDWTRMQAAGQLIIHSARLAPGALVRELSVLLRGPAILELARDSVVSLGIANGRVFHHGLTLCFPELTIRTQGWVGFDGSLALIAEMPLPPKWLGSSAPARALAGQTIRLPLGGTLLHPQLDQHALRAASAQFLRNTAEDTLRRELDKQLEKTLHFRK